MPSLHGPFWSRWSPVLGPHGYDVLAPTRIGLPLGLVGLLASGAVVPPVQYLSTPAACYRYGCYVLPTGAD